MHTGSNGQTYEACYLRSETGNPLTKYVNLCQSPQERRDKYAYCRFFGLSPNHAHRMPDWHWTKINLLVQYFNKQLPLHQPTTPPCGQPSATTTGDSSST